MPSGGWMHAYLVQVCIFQCLCTRFIFNCYSQSASRAQSVIWEAQRGVNSWSSFTSVFNGLFLSLSFLFPCVFFRCLLELVFSHTNPFIVKVDYSIHVYVPWWVSYLTSFCFQNDWISLRHRFHKMLEALLAKTMSYWLDSITLWFKICGMHSCDDANLLFRYVSKLNILLRIMFKKTWFDICDTILLVRAGSISRRWS